MKVSLKQLEAIIKLMVTEASVDQLEESEIHNVLNFLKEFKLDDYRIKELLLSADQMELEEALSIINQLDQPTQQELSNRLFNLIMADGAVSEPECNSLTNLILHFKLPVPDSAEVKKWLAKLSDEASEEEILSNEEEEVVTATDDHEALCFFVIEPSGNDAYFMGKCCAYLRVNRNYLSEEVIASHVLKCRKSTLLEWKNLPVLNAVTEDMGYTSYGDYRAYIAKHPSDQSENKAASKLLGKKVYGPCLIQFVSKEGKFQYMRKKLCPTFYKYLQRRLGCYMTFFHKYIGL
jgi:uncharacterized tellurite resistance protein B-like protein